MPITAAEIRVIDSTLYIRSLDKQGRWIANDDGLVHITPFYMLAPFNDLYLPGGAWIAHLTQCWTLARGVERADDDAPLTCVFCLGWSGLKPLGFTLIDLRT